MRKLFVSLAAASLLIVLANCGGPVDTTGPANPDPSPTGSATPGSSATPTASPAPATEIRFIAIGDTGTGSTDQYAVAAAIKDKCDVDNCDFGVLLGDNFYPTGVNGVTDPQWQEKLELPYQNLDFPFYLTLGNHDYGGDGAGYEFDMGTHQIAYAEASEKWILPAEYYAFEKGAATFMAFGTNLVFWDNQGAVDEQGAFFAQVADESTMSWKIGMGHHPYLSNGKHGNAGAYDGLPFVPIANGEHVKRFFDDYMCDRLDLYLSGHDHSRQIIVGDSSCPTTFVVSGAGAKTTELPGSNPSEYQIEFEGFAYIIVTGEKITIEMYGMDGSFEHSHEITK